MRPNLATNAATGPGRHTSVTASDTGTWPNGQRPSSGFPVAARYRDQFKPVSDTGGVRFGHGYIRRRFPQPQAVAR